MIVSSCCDIPEGKDLCAVWHEIGRPKSCVKCHSTNEHREKQRENSAHLMAERIDSKRTIIKQQAEAASSDWSGFSTRRQALQTEVTTLLFWHSIAELPSFLEKTCRGDGVLVRGLYSMFRFETFQRSFRGAHDFETMSRSIWVYRRVF